MIERTYVSQFLDDLASGAPTPGGGGAAAATGAMGAALLSMVCNLTVGKKAYAAVEADIRAALARSEALRASLQELVAEDARVFDAVMSAYSLPRSSEDEKAARQRAIQAALHAATLVPMQCARQCLEVIELSGQVAAEGNTNVLSDAGVGVACAYAALRSAALNVYINTRAIDDQAFSREQLQALERLLARGAEMSESVYAAVVRRVR